MSVSVSALDGGDAGYNLEYELEPWWVTPETNYTHECINESRSFNLSWHHRHVDINASDLEALCLSFVNLTEEQVGLWRGCLGMGLGFKVYGLWFRVYAGFCYAF